MENNKDEIMKLVAQKEEIEAQINEKLGIENTKSNNVNELLRLLAFYQETIEQNTDLINRVAHTSNIQSFKEMLYVDFLDLKNSNDSKTYEEFKNYVEIAKKRPQVEYDLDKFHEAIKDIEFFHLEDDFFNNEYGLSERTDGLDVYSCKNDFKEINSKLEVTVNE